jgi:hypothetical protein
MNNIKLVFLPEDGESVDMCKKSLSSLFENKTCVINWQDNLMWSEVTDPGHGDFCFSKLKHYYAFKSLVKAQRMFSIEKSDFKNLIDTYPHGSEQFKNNEDFEQAFADGSATAKEFGGSSTFTMVSKIKRFKMNEITCGYKTTARSWHPISWKAQAYYSSQNHGVIIKMSQELNLLHTVSNPGGEHYKFMADFPGIMGSVIIPNPNRSGDYCWSNNGEPIDVESTTSMYVPMLYIESTCINGAIISVDVNFKKVSCYKATSKSTARRSENPWNALPEHVVWSNNGEPTLRQPLGAGPNREENYDPNAVIGGAATHPLVSHQESDELDSDFEMFSGYDRAVNDIARILSGRVELPESIALTA